MAAMSRVGGRIAGVGQRLIESTAKSITRQGLTALDQMIAARLEPAVALAEAVEEQAGTPALQEIARVRGCWLEAVGGSTGEDAVQLQGGGGINPSRRRRRCHGGAAVVSMASVGVQVVKDVARDVAADYIPADKQEKVLYFSLGALAMLLFVVLVRLVQRD